ncbi:MAG: alpha/beta hydrolase [Burkholderiales bacterium]|nr:alpha/beta hydrolase [Burkholderiales bacterium]MDE2451981.1 alpha/beta hydrolase [Burkholderiales bacterium]
MKPVAAPVWRGFDQAALDREYDARATVPDIQPILRRYAEGSAAARAALPCVLDVAYGEHADETLDLFPAATPGAPVFVFVHGGYWRLLSKNESSLMAPAFTAAGATVVAVNYSLAPAATLDRIVDQNRRALAWIHRHIGEHHGDARRIHLGGSSAGAHLVGMLLAGGWHADHGVPEDLVRGALLLSGLYELEPLVHTHVNAWMRLSPEDALRNSPLAHLPARGCPLICAYGENETAEFRRQTDAFLAAWQARGFEGRQVPMPGTNHFDIVLQLNDPASALTQAVFRQMGLQPHHREST